MQIFTDPPKKADPKKPAGRGGGDDALENADPNDSRADEKVIVNTQQEDKIVNAPSQTAPYADGEGSSDEEIVNQ